jgi:hypothetical protein
MKELGQGGQVAPVGGGRVRREMPLETKVIVECGQRVGIGAEEFVCHVLDL